MPDADLGGGLHRAERRHAARGKREDEGRALQNRVEALLCRAYRCLCIVTHTSILLSLLMVLGGGELILDHGHALDAREGDDVGHPLLQSIPYLLKIDLLRTETHLHRPNRKNDQNQPYILKLNGNSEVH